MSSSAVSALTHSLERTLATEPVSDVDAAFLRGWGLATELALSLIEGRRALDQRELFAGTPLDYEEATR